jgi:hypothetical protein
LKLAACVSRSQKIARVAKTLNLDFYFAKPQPNIELSAARQAMKFAAYRGVRLAT